MGELYLTFLGLSAVVTFHFAQQLNIPKAWAYALGNFILPAVPLSFILYLKFVHIPHKEAIERGEIPPENPILKPIKKVLTEHVKPKIIEAYKTLGVNKEYVEKEERRQNKKKRKQKKC